MADHEELIRRKLDDELRPEDEDRFSRLMDEDPSFAEIASQAMILKKDLEHLPYVPDPGTALTDRIMAAVPAAPPGDPGRPPIILRRVAVPVWGLALSLLVVSAALVWLAARPHTARQPPPPSPTPAAISRAECTAPRLLVRFVLKASDAQTVSLAGDFNDWSLDATPLRDQDGNGVWTVSVPLTPGRYQYKFLVDGKRWVVEPDAPAYQPDGFGGRNSLLSI